LLAIKRSAEVKMALTIWVFATLCLLSMPAAAQQQTPTWAQLPRMHLDRQFAGPLQDTLIQRWRDPVDGIICYIYLPITAQHSPPAQSGYVQYGANTIGSISCVTPLTASTAPAQRKTGPAQRTPTSNSPEPLPNQPSEGPNPSRAPPPR
jgi:hypothetical protein